MKAIIASLAALGFVASPALAAQNTMSNTTAPAKATTHHTSSKIAHEAKKEGESTATEAKEHKAAAHHSTRHHATCSCPSKYAHKGTMHHKASAKKASTKTPKQS